MLFSSCIEEKKSSEATESRGYTITGISTKNDGYAYLQGYDQNNEIFISDSVALINSSFTFKGQVNNLEPYQVIVNQEMYPLVLENTKYVLEKDVIVGTKLQEAYNTYYEGLVKTENAFVYQRNYIKSHPESMLAAIVLKTMLGKTEWRINQNKLAYDGLEDPIKQSYLGKEIYQFIQKNINLLEDNGKVILEKVSEIVIENNDVKENSKPIEVVKIKNTVTKKKPLRYSGINFEADNLNGDNFKLSDIIVTSNYVLIDFWASGCAPCRKQNPYLVDVYNRYRDEGFDIVSVSEDRSKQAWEIAIEQDGLEWHHVIDDFSRLTKLFNVESIPHTILINSEGDIIASDISPYALEAKLSGLLR